MLRRHKSSRGVLRKEVAIVVKGIKRMEDNPFLIPDAVRVLTEANETAREIFEGSHGLSEGGYLMPLPDDKRWLPHPCENLFLDVGECVSALLELKKLSQRIFTPRSSLAGLHLHRRDGSIVDVEIDNNGIILVGI